MPAEIIQLFAPRPKVDVGTRVLTAEGTGFLTPEGVLLDGGSVVPASSVIRVLS